MNKMPSKAKRKLNKATEEKRLNLKNKTSYKSISKILKILRYQYLYFHIFILEIK
jgi:hypothetical protein